MFGWHQTSPSSGRSSPRHTRHRSVIVPTSTGGSSSACWERYLSSSLLSVPVWNQNWFCFFWTMYFEWNESSTIHLELVQNYPFRVWRFSAKPFISCFCSLGGVAWASVELLGSTAPVFLSYGLEWFESIFFVSPTIWWLSSSQQFQTLLYVFHPISLPSWLRFSHPYTILKSYKIQ